MFNHQQCDIAPEWDYALKWKKKNTNHEQPKWHTRRDWSDRRCRASCRDDHNI